MTAPIPATTSCCRRYKVACVALSKATASMLEVVYSPSCGSCRRVVVPPSALVKQAHDNKNQGRSGGSLLTLSAACLGLAAVLYGSPQGRGWRASTKHRLMRPRWVMLLLSEPIAHCIFWAQNFLMLASVPVLRVTRFWSGNMQSRLVLTLSGCKARCLMVFLTAEQVVS